MATETVPRARAEARSTPEAAVETVDAERARWWLAANVSNRDLRLNHAEEIARAMLRDEWELSPDAIAFDTEGRLINGQHRLIGVARSGVACEFVVVRGLPAKSQETTDTGAKRHLRDMLKLRDVPDASNVAPVLNYVWKYLRYGTLVPPQIPPTVQEQLALWERHEDIIESVRYIRPRTKRGPISTATCAALHYLFAQVDRDDADLFFEKLAAGTDLSEGDPILVLRRQLERAANRAKTSYSVTPYAKAAWIIKCWNAWQEGRTVNNFVWRAGGGSAEGYPMIAMFDPQAVDPVLNEMPGGPTPSGRAKAGVEELLGGR